MALERLTRSDPLQLGPFTVLARLGAGGMGVVYLAEDADGFPVAVKVVKAELARDPAFRARFKREVEAGRRVSGLCTARFAAADTLAFEPWLATEFVPGPTLHAEVHRKGPLDATTLLALGAGLADALVSIHSAGLVHRDLKPANVILAPDAPKVIDFGVALAADATALTATGTLVGSPAYMSPEQAQGVTEVTPAADVFSWASTMAFAGRGVPPFGEGESAGILYRVVNEPPDLDGIDPVVVPMLLAALDKDPSQRPSAGELASWSATALGTAGAAWAPPGSAAGPEPSGVGGPGAGATAVLAAWQPPPGAADDAGGTLVEARRLRHEVPPREAEVRREERRRANRAIMGTALFATSAVVGVSALFIRAASDREMAVTQTKERGSVPTVAGDDGSGGGATPIDPALVTATEPSPSGPAGGEPVSGPSGPAPTAAGGPVVQPTAPSTTRGLPPTSTTTVPSCSVTVDPPPDPSSGAWTGMSFGRPYTVTASVTGHGGYVVLLRRVAETREDRRVAWSLEALRSQQFLLVRDESARSPEPEERQGATVRHYEGARRPLEVVVVRAVDHTAVLCRATPGPFESPAA